MQGREGGHQDIAQDLFNRPFESGRRLLGLVHRPFWQGQRNRRHMCFQMQMPQQDDSGILT